MKTSEQIGELAAALAKAQGEMRHAAKDAQNPHLRNRYADLASVLDACREPLARNGLSVVQPAESGDGVVRVTTRLMHASGQWIESELAIPYATGKGTSDAQALGSALTYGRRYGLSAMVGIAADDDDGAGAGAKKPKRETAEEKGERQAAHDPSWAADQARFMARLATIGTTYDDVCALTADRGRPRPSAMTQEQRDGLLAWLESRAAKGAA
jgi:hypothetical protein